MILVIDQIRSKGDAEVESFIHFAPQTEIQINDFIWFKIGSDQMKIQTFGVSKVTKEKGFYSPKFNYKVDNEYLSLKKGPCTSFFGYVICLEDSDCKLHLSNNILKVEAKDLSVINLEELGDKI